MLRNAIKYSPEKTRIVFELDHDDTNIYLTVKDSGIGIPEEDQADLFQPFHRATNFGKIEGADIGLSIAKEYVELHNGSIEVESELGKGSTFRVFLPLA